MKIHSFVVVFVLGIVAGLFTAGIMLNLSAERIMLKEVISPYDFNKTVDIIRNRINNANGWKVVAIINQGVAVAPFAGKEKMKLKIIQYCSGKYAGEMLSSDDRKKMAVMMPKSFAVYEKDDGRVYIAFMNGAYVGKIFGGKAYSIIEKVSLEIEKILMFTGFKYSLF